MKLEIWQGDFFDCTRWVESRCTHTSHEPLPPPPYTQEPHPIVYQSHSLLHLFPPSEALGLFDAVWDEASFVVINIADRQKWALAHALLNTHTDTQMNTDEHLCTYADVHTHRHLKICESFSVLLFPPSLSRFADILLSLMKPRAAILMGGIRYDQKRWLQAPFSIDTPLVQKHFGRYAYCAPLVYTAHTAF